VSRCPRYTMPTDLPVLASLVARLGVATLIVDVEPLLRSWGSHTAGYMRNAERMQALVAAAAPTVTDIIFASNSPRDLAPLGGPCRLRTTVVAGARKPWLTWYARGRPRPIAVLGDQIMTDGILAWRLHGDFIHICIEKKVPWWPRIQRAIGQLFTHSLFAEQITDGIDERQ
jgi:hypothetical protein